MKNPIIKSILIIIFGFLFSSQTSISAERNLQKCREFSSIGLHLPAIEQCQKAMRDGVNREAELELLYYLANSYSSINKNKLAKEAITKLLNASPSIFFVYLLDYFFPFTWSFFIFPYFFFTIGPSTAITKTS